MKNQTIFSDLGGNLIYITHFGISTGEKSGYYTLRAYGNKVRHTQTEHGTSSSSEDASVYVRNLSTDKQQAIEAARAYLSEHYPNDRLDERVNFNLDEIDRISREQAEAQRAAEAARVAATDFSIFQGGKYAGRSVTDVLAGDKSYCEWFSGNYWHKDSDNARTAAIINAILAPGREQAAKATKGRAEYLVSQIGESTLHEWLLGRSGGFLSSIAHGLKSGNAPQGRGLDILLEIISKWAGRTNSKAYSARLEELTAALQ